MHRYNPRRREGYECSSDSDAGEMDYKFYLDPHNQISQKPLTYIPEEGIGAKGKNYMVLHTASPTSEQGIISQDSESNQHKSEVCFSSLLNSIGDPDTLLQQGSAHLMLFLSSSQRLFWFFMVILASFFFYPMTSTLITGGLGLVLIGGHQNEDSKSTTRTAKWTVTGFTQQMKDGFLASPAFLDRCGQWRMVVKQKKGMDGLQTSFGLLCTDIFPHIELVTANVTFFCTNQLGQEVSTGGMRNLKFQHEYHCPGDCGFSRPIRISRRHLGESETIIVHSTVEFRKKTVTFLKTLARNLRLGYDGDSRGKFKKGKNVVTEHGSVYPGDLEFHEETSLPPAFRPVMRFVQRCETRTFVWEIPGFTTILENAELWGVYSPQFFVHSHDVCSIWRMKLIEAHGIFRLHVQLRGLPSSVKQVKLWYLLQLVDMYGDSVIPEHAICRVKYPDYMNLWDTTRHILYRRETMMDRFIDSNGALCMRISLQMEPNDLTLMEVDSDEWIHSPTTNTPGISDGPHESTQDGSRGLLYELTQTKTQMLTG